MKKNYNLIYTLAAALLFSTASFAQATIAQWNFNGLTNASIPGMPNSPTPSVGAGTASLIGGVTSPATQNNGNTSTGTLETETTSPPNFGWQTLTYPAQGTGEKTAGVQFNVNTTGQIGITFRWEQRHSNNSANTYCLQYCTDVTAGSPVWVDGQTFTVTPTDTSGDTWYNDRIVNLSAVTALDNNPNVGFRVVSAYDPGAGAYLATKLGNTYAGTGTARFDMVTITSASTMATPEFDGNNNTFRISPNPSNKEIVSFNQAYDVEVYDTTGKVIFKGKDVSSVDTRSFTSGVYFIKTQTGATQKLIVK